jgi:hypothetical protein
MAMAMGKAKELQGTHRPSVRPGSEAMTSAGAAVDYNPRWSDADCTRAMYQAMIDALIREVESD